MPRWPQDELRRIAAADELLIAPLRRDGATYRTPTVIWSVAVDDALYVRTYDSPNSRWYNAALRQGAGRITAAGLTREVVFEAVEGPINRRIDAAYNAKYRDSPYLGPVVDPSARVGTIRIVPRGGDA